MSDRISRRDFLKISGVGAAISAVVTGCGPVSRYIVRQPYAHMPEYNQTGLSTYYASACRECPAGCGIIVRTKEGRALTIEGNPQHPVNHGKLCARGITVQQGLYNPDRFRGPLNQARGSAAASDLTWDDAIQIVTGALGQNAAQTAFLVGMAPDHLYDFLVELTDSLGAPAPVRYNALTSLEGRSTLLAASERVFGNPGLLPYFDLANADVAFSFGADFLQSWLSPVAYSRQFGQFRQGRTTRRGYLVVFEARQSLTASNADEWIPIKPGSEGAVAAALYALVAKARGLEPAEAVDLAAVESLSGVSAQRLTDLAALFAGAEHPLALPGGAALAQPAGVDAATVVLALNQAAGNIGQPGGVFLSPNPIVDGGYAAVTDLISRMQAGQVKTLFIHNANPLFELPAAAGFEAALEKVPTVISFASFPDETALKSDYVLPDHSPLESFGYQRTLAGADRRAYSSIQPVVSPLYNTRATVDVLLAASGSSLPYTDEVDFLQQKIAALMTAGGSYTADEIFTFWSLWLQNGGWWPASAELTVPETAETLTASAPSGPAGLEEGKQFYLLTYANHFGDGSGANRPWLQEMPDSLTTVTWNSWVEINPKTAEELGVTNDDIVKISTADGEIEASVYLFPAIRPDTIALPFGQGHTALGRWAEGRGANPAKLFADQANPAGELAYGALLATITPTGSRRPLARIESILGVYGEE